MRLRIDPAKEARHRAAMGRLGVYGAIWAVAKEVGHADVVSRDSRRFRGREGQLLFQERTVRDGPIPKLFPELQRKSDNRTPVLILNADGVEEVARIFYLPPNAAYRIAGPGWIRFVKATGISAGDRVDVYTCLRDDGCDGERCLLFFKSKGRPRPQRVRSNPPPLLNCTPTPEEVDKVLMEQLKSLELSGGKSFGTGP
jgi:hypothetical protein